MGTISKNRCQTKLTASRSPKSTTTNRKTTAAASKSTKKAKKTRQKKSVFKNLNNELALIHFYRDHDCLWNARNKDYYNRPIKQYLWQWIGNQFGLSVVQVKHRMQMLRKRWEEEKMLTLMYREYGQTYTPKFQHLMNEMSFLDNPCINYNGINEIFVFENDKNDAYASGKPQATYVLTPLHLTNSDVDSIGVETEELCEEIKTTLTKYPKRKFCKVKQKLLNVLNRSGPKKPMSISA